MAGPSSSRLNSWKEIAEYIGRDMRTAMRWEEERGLPVRRVPGGKRQAVFALTDELDAWLNQQEIRWPAGDSRGPEAEEGLRDAPPGKTLFHARTLALVCLGILVAGGFLLVWWRAGASTSPGLRFQWPDQSLRFARSDLPTGALAAYLVDAVDLDEDGVLDIVAGGISTPALGVFRGRGDGTFDAQKEFDACSIGGLASADLNRDGHVDVIISCYWTESLLVKWGDGKGGFASQEEIPVFEAPRRMAIGDLNGDSWPDVVVASEAEGRLAVLLNNQGRLQPQSQYELEQGVIEARLADLNGDGLLDVIVANFNWQSDRLFLLYGNGDGTLRPAQPLRAGRTPLSVRDVRYPDGAAGLVVTSMDGQLSVFRATAGETVSMVSRIPFAPSTAFLERGDLDGDGFLDLLFVNNWNGNLMLLKGAKDGTFVQSTTAALNGRPFIPVLADLNRDGRLDAVIPAGMQHSLVVLLQMPRD